jgi:hypothetical protein
MSAGRMWAAQFAAAIVVGIFVLTCATANAAGQQWSGRYSLTTFASQKSGTSIAARQPEPDFSAEYLFRTDCSSGRCVATVVDGPLPSNPTIPQPQRYIWDGTQWIFSYAWQWECFRGDGVPRVYTPARSSVVYVPLSDGSLQGTWHTEILGGACQGNVSMPVSAYPAASG